MVRYGPGHKEESRLRIVEAAGRSFRRQGYGGVGVDGLAEEAGVTHGAFYGHFRSKADAFKAAVVAGLQQLRDAVVMVRQQSGSDWVQELSSFYMGYKRTCDLGDACTLPTLSQEIERANPETRVAYQVELLDVMTAVAAGMPGETDAERQTRAWALLALLAGGVTMARAVPDKVLSEEIGAAIRSAAHILGDHPGSK